MAFCKYCGNKLKDGAKFCTKCGKPQGEVPQAASQVPPQQGDNVSQQVPPQQGNSGASPQIPQQRQQGGAVPPVPPRQANGAAPQPKKNHTGLAVLIIVLIIVAALAAVGFIFRENIMDMIRNLTGGGQPVINRELEEDEEELDTEDTEDEEDTENSEVEEDTEQDTEAVSETETEELSGAAPAAPTEEPEGREIPADITEDGRITYLALGNTMTAWTPVNPYWWGSWGAAATKRELDYVHRVEAGLSEMYPGVPVAGTAKNFYDWETAPNRSNVYNQIDGDLYEGLDIVILQLGECVDEGQLGAAGMTTLTEDYIALIEHIEERAPGCRVILLGNFWSDPDSDSYKIEASMSTDAAFADLNTIKDNPDYQIGKGSSVQGDDGRWHKITEDAVAKAPNDEGMRAMAQAVLNALTTWNPELSIPLLR